MRFICNFVLCSVFMTYCNFCYLKNVIRLHCYAKRKTQPTVIDVAWCVCASVCWIQPWAVQKRMNRSKCHSGYGLEWAQGTMYYRWGPASPHGKGQFFGGHKQHPALYSVDGSSDAAFRCQSTAAICYHRLRRSASPVLTATALANGEWKNSTPRRIHTS